MINVTEIVAAITPRDAAFAEQATARQLQLTKPTGSLGRLEDILEGGNVLGRLEDLLGRLRKRAQLPLDILHHARGVVQTHVDLARRRVQTLKDRPHLLLKLR